MPHSLLLEVIRDEEREVEALLKVETRVAEGLVAQAELLLGEAHAAPDALGDAEPVLGELARELEAHAVHPRTGTRVRTDARCQLADDGAEVACFEAR